MAFSFIYIATTFIQPNNNVLACPKNFDKLLHGHLSKTFVILMYAASLHAPPVF